MATNNKKIELLSGGELAYVSLAHIVDHPEIKKTQRPLDKEFVATLAKDIARNGLINPLLVWNGGGKGVVAELPSGKEAAASFLVAGNHRRAALRAFQKDDPDAFRERFESGIPVYVISGDMKDVLSAQLRENIQRKDPEAGEILPVIKRLMSKEFGMRQKDVARAIGKSEGYVSQMLAIEEELGEEAAEEMAAGNVRVSEAKAAAQEVRKAKKAGKPISGKEALAKAKAKSGALKAAGRERSVRKTSAAVIWKRYGLLPRTPIGEKLGIIEAALSYLAGETEELPEELNADVEEETKKKKTAKNDDDDE